MDHGYLRQKLSEITNLKADEKSDEKSALYAVFSNPTNRQQPDEPTASSEMCKGLTNREHSSKCRK